MEDCLPGSVNSVVRFEELESASLGDASIKSAKQSPPIEEPGDELPLHFGRPETVADLLQQLQGDLARHHRRIESSLEESLRQHAEVTERAWRTTGRTPRSTASRTTIASRATRCLATENNFTSPRRSIFGATRRRVSLMSPTPKGSRRTSPPPPLGASAQPEAQWRTSSPPPPAPAEDVPSRIPTTSPATPVEPRGSGECSTGLGQYSKRVRGKVQVRSSVMSGGSTNSAAQRAWKHLISDPSRKRSTGQRWREDQSSLLKQVTEHWGYEVLKALLIFLNALLVVWEAEHRSQVARSYHRGDALVDEVHFIAFHNIFASLFAVDIVLRVISARWWFFFSSLDGLRRPEMRGSNVFDCIVVSTAILECAVSHAMGADRITLYVDPLHAQILIGSSMLCIVRFLLLVRVTRMIRMDVGFRELRVLVDSLCDCWRTLVWCLAVMAVILLTFGIFFTEGAIRHCLRYDTMHDPTTAELRGRFGTLRTSMRSLFMAITSGDDWINIVSPLERMDQPLYPFAFYAFVVFAVFALLNLVTAVFVNSAVQRSQSDRDFVIQAETQGKREFLRNMEKFFKEIDRDHSGSISLGELQRHMEAPHVAAYFSALNLDISQVKTLFSLIDIDHSNSIDQDEFIWGCLRLRGDAKSLDVAILLYEVKSLRDLLARVIEIDDELLAETPFADALLLAQPAALPNAVPAAVRRAAAGAAGGTDVMNMESLRWEELEV